MTKSEALEILGQHDAAFQAAKYLVAVDNSDFRGMRLAETALKKLGWELRRINDAMPNTREAVSK